MINRKIIKIIVPILVVLFCPIFNALAFNEDDVVKSAEHVVSLWKIKSDYYDFVHVDKSAFPNYIWTIHRFFPHKDSFSYDVTKTTSLVTPYVLKISFKAKGYGNSDSSRADLQFGSHKLGFSTKEKAATCISDSDFNYNRRTVIPELSIWDLTVYYAFQKENWIFKNVGHHRKGEMTELLKSEATRELFIIPVKNESN